MEKAAMQATWIFQVSNICLKKNRIWRLLWIVICVR